MSILNSFKDVNIVESYTGTEPVTLAETKAHCRVDFTDDDALLTSLITAARMVIEDYCHISLVPKVVTLGIEAQESLQSIYAQPYQVRQNFNDFELPYGPVSSVDVVTTVDSDGITVEALALNSDYFVYGTDFKTIKILNNFTNNTIVYRVGYGTLPGPLRLAILNEILYRYENRGDEGAIRATAFTEVGVCQSSRILANKYRRLSNI
jgi:uncharacterized phiE125 gp8 family phage protein